MSEEILKNAIQLLEAGKSPAEILAIHGNNPELKADLEIINSISRQGKSITPRLNLKPNIKQALMSLPEKKPALKLANFLQNRLKYILPVLAFTSVFLIIFAYKDFKRRPLPAENLKQASLAPEGILNADIQKTVDGIISDYTSDSQIAIGGDTDINDLKKTYSTFNLSDIYNENNY